MTLFADNIVLYASTTSNFLAVRKLQRQINEIEPWFSQWKISINPVKTNEILFSNKSSLKKQKPKIKNTLINWSNSIKYFGVQIDINSNFSKHVHQSIYETNAAAFLLFSILNLKCPLSIQTKSQIYKMYILPILTYA